MTINNVCTNETSLVTSPTKDEVKEERDMLHSIATVFERKLESSTRKVKSLETKSRMLAHCLREEKSRSRSAMGKLIAVTATQTEELIATFQKKLTELKSDHDTTICKLQCIINDCIVKLQQKNDASVRSLIISCDGLWMKLSTLEDKLVKLKERLHEEKSKRRAQVTVDESKRKKLEDEIDDLNEWLLELDDERKAAKANEKKALEKYYDSVSVAQLSLHKWHKERNKWREIEDKIAEKDKSADKQRKMYAHLMDEFNKAATAN